jgi:hypothetical protein
MSEFDIKIQELYAKGSKFKYNPGDSGNNKLQTWEEVEKTKKAHCIEMTNWAYHAFNFTGATGKVIKPVCYFIAYIKDGEIQGCHAVPVFLDSIYVEMANDKYKGIYHPDNKIEVCKLLYRQTKKYWMSKGQEFGAVWTYIPDNKRKTSTRFICENILEEGKEIKWEPTVEGYSLKENRYKVSNTVGFIGDET